MYSFLGHLSFSLDRMLLNLPNIEQNSMRIMSKLIYQ